MALVAALIYIFVRFIISERERKEHNEIMIKNCSLFQRECGYFYKISNLAYEEQTPRQPINYVVIRRVDDEDMIIAANLETGKDVYTEWTEEDVKGIEAAVYVSSTTGTAHYRPEGGTGNTVSAKYEKVDLFYYNTENGQCFKTDTIDHDFMPERTKYVSDKMISDQEIAETVENTIKNLSRYGGYDYYPEQSSYESGSDAYDFGQFASSP